MLAHADIDHQDVIRIIGSSEESFDKAVATAIASIREGHKGSPRWELHFTSFEVVQLQGIIQDAGGENKPFVKRYQAVVDVVGHHHHHDHDHDHGSE